LPFPFIVTIESNMNNPSNHAAYRPDVKISSLGEKIGDPVRQADFPATILRYRNDRAAATVGLANLTDAEWISHFGRFNPLPQNMPLPLALRYHGHQFRQYNPDIGDGRGFLFAQLRDQAGRLLDLGTKGSGTTPYSRAGDGRLTLKGGVREILATEMLEALGVNTSKTFSLIETGEQLMRGDEPSPTRSAVMVRLNHSHIRFGTFQRIAFEGNEDLMAKLITYCLNHLYSTQISANPAAQLLELAVDRVADLAASYMVAGFVHGVLNTDNINITGESFDYGPWRFTPNWDPRFTAAYFDEHGLYAFGRQAEALHWNLGQLAVALRLVSDAPPLIAALAQFPLLFQRSLIRRFLGRLGVKSNGDEADRLLVEAAERAMISGSIEIDTFFQTHWAGRIGHLAFDNESYQQFLSLLSSYEAAIAVNDHWEEAPKCSMHLIEVEAIWDAIASRDDWQPMNIKIKHIREMGFAMKQ
jgi:serine/tyrosine/threonine adenylyltransferase